MAEPPVPGPQQPADDAHHRRPTGERPPDNLANDAQHHGQPTDDHPHPNQPAGDPRHRDRPADPTAHPDRPADEPDPHGVPAAQRPSTGPSDRGDSPDTGEHPAEPSEDGAQDVAGQPGGQAATRFPNQAPAGARRSGRTGNEARPLGRRDIGPWGSGESASGNTAHGAVAQPSGGGRSSGGARPASGATPDGTRDRAATTAGPDGAAGPRGASGSRGAGAGSVTGTPTTGADGAAARRDRASARATNAGPGRALIFVYGLFAVAAGARATVQIASRFDEAPLAYGLSAVAAVIYLVAAVGLARDGGWGRRLALVCCAVELAGVLTVGTASLLWPDAFPDATVWSLFGAGYAFVPLVLPVLGLTWLRRTA